MDFTNGFIALDAIYNQKCLNIEQILRLEYNYNGLVISLLYTQKNDTKYEIVLIIRTKNEDYPLSFHINHGNGTYELNPFFNYNYTAINRQYRKLNNNNNLSPVQLFAYLNSNITKSQVHTENANYITRVFNNAPNHECPYYMTYRRSKMSQKMKAKIREKYTNHKEIIDFFDKQNNCTLVFTSDPQKAKKLVLKL